MSVSNNNYDDFINIAFNFFFISDAGALDNPTYDPCHITSSSPSHNNDDIERDFENPLYDESHVTSSTPQLKNSQLTKGEQETQNTLYSYVAMGTANSANHDRLAITNTDSETCYYEEGPCCESKTVNGNAVYEDTVTTSTLVQLRRDKMNDKETNISEKATAELEDTDLQMYVNMPPTLNNTQTGAVGVASDDCYSTLGSTYSQVQPHLSKSVHQLPLQIPSTKDGDYSSLQHK